MRRRAKLFFTLICAIVAVLAATEVVARECYDPVGSTCTADLGKKGLWTATVVSAGNEVTRTDPSTRESITGYDYVVEVCGPGDGCTHVGLGQIILGLSDDCCPTGLEILWSSPSFTPDSGNTPVDDYVKHLTFYDWDSNNPDDNTWEMITNSDQFRPQTISIKSAESWGSCEIMAPYCPGEVIVGVRLPPESCVTLLTGKEPPSQNPLKEKCSASFETDDQGNPIPQSYLFYDNVDCSGVGKTPDEFRFDPTLVYSTGGPGQPNISYTVRTASPPWITINAGGYVIKYCVGSCS